MEESERRRIEILVGAIFIVVLLIVVSLVLILASPSQKTEITNSYNTYNLETRSSPSHVDSVKPYILDRGYDVYYVRGDRRYVNDYYDKRYLNYDSYSNFEVSEGLFGNDIDKYNVYVFNREYAGGYFKTTFYFEDYYGNVETEVITHYIGPREEQRFIIKDVSPSRYEYRSWWYEVKSMTQAPTRVYYNN